MTSSIKVKSHNYPVWVQVVDRLVLEEFPGPENAVDKIVSETILWPEDGEREFYCTTSRRLHILDLAMDDPRALAVKKAAT